MRLVLVSVALVLLASVAGAQVEKGDSEILFAGSLMSTVGMESSSSQGSFTLVYGYFFTKNLELGVGPTVSITTSSYGGESETTTELSSTFFGQYNFTTAGKNVPYLTASWYQMDFSPEDEESFTDYSFVTAGGGLRMFFNEYAAFNTSALYGFSLAENAEGGIILIQTGLSFIF